MKQAPYIQVRAGRSVMVRTETGYKSTYSIECKMSDQHRWKITGGEDGIWHLPTREAQKAKLDELVGQGATLVEPPATEGGGE